jgi:hypothetical protein
LFVMHFPPEMDATYTPVDSDIILQGEDVGIDIHGGRSQGKHQMKRYLTTSQRGICTQ